MRLIERTEYLDPLKRVRNIQYQGNNRNSSFRKVQIIRLLRNGKKDKKANVAYAKGNKTVISEDNRQY